jgi:hypothetical protein
VTVGDHRDSTPWSSDEAERYWRELSRIERELGALRERLSSRPPHNAVEVTSPTKWRVRANATTAIVLAVLLTIAVGLWVFRARLG